jgi:hypothetical protein
VLKRPVLAAVDREFQSVTDVLKALSTSDFS